MSVSRTALLVQVYSEVALPPVSGLKTLQREPDEVIAHRTANSNVSVLIDMSAIPKKTEDGA